MLIIISLLQQHLVYDDSFFIVTLNLYNSFLHQFGLLHSFHRCLFSISLIYSLLYICFCVCLLQRLFDERSHTTEETDNVALVYYPHLTVIASEETASDRGDIMAVS